MSLLWMDSARPYFPSFFSGEEFNGTENMTPCPPKQPDKFGLDLIEMLCLIPSTLRH